MQTSRQKNVLSKDIYFNTSIKFVYCIVYCGVSIVKKFAKHRKKHWKLRNRCIDKAMYLGKKNI